MTIDDYCQSYGVDYITIDAMYLSATDGAAQERARRSIRGAQGLGAIRC